MARDTRRPGPSRTTGAWLCSLAAAALLVAAAPAAAQWSAAHLPTADVRDLAFSPDDANTLYLATHGGGLYESRDRGRAWTAVAGVPFRTLTAVAIDPRNGQRILVAGASDPTGLAELAGIAVSTDGGRTWRRPTTDQRLVRARHSTSTRTRRAASTPRWGRPTG